MTYYNHFSSTANQGYSSVISLPNDAKLIDSQIYQRFGDYVVTERYETPDATYFVANGTVQNGVTRSRIDSEITRMEGHLSYDLYKSDGLGVVGRITHNDYKTYEEAEADNPDSTYDYEYNAGSENQPSMRSEQVFIYENEILNAV